MAATKYSIGRKIYTFIDFRLHHLKAVTFSRTPFSLCAGPITNLVVVPLSSLQPRMNHQKASNQFRVSVLDKYSKPADPSEGVFTFLHSNSSEEDHHIASGFQSTDLLKQQTLELERGETPEAIQMRVEMSIESQAWATRMTKHVMEMNAQLQSRLLDMMQSRLLQPPGAGSSAGRKRKKTNAESPSLKGEEKQQPDSQGS